MARGQRSERKNDTKRWIRSDADKHAADLGCWFDLGAAERVVEFYGRFLRHSKGQWAGKPFHLLDWQREDVMMPLFGWKRPNGTRRYRQGYVEVAKKNGKSTLMAGLNLYLTMADGEPGAEVYCAATDRPQAAIVFNEAASMVLRSPDLARRLEVIYSSKRILHPASGSVLVALSREASSNEGLNIHGLTIDELHAHRTRRLYDALRYGGAARRQPLMLAISTAGWDRNTVCWEQHEYARRVLEWTVQDPWFFAYMAAAAPEDDWTDEATWKKANPSYGITLNADDFANECAEAKASPAKENAFKRYRLSLWTQQAQRWMQMHRWDLCGAPFDVAELKGRTCFAGLDMSSTTDVSALVLVFPPTASDPMWRMLPWFWVPADNAQAREDVDKVPYMTWARAGLVKLTDGEVVDYDVVRADLNEIAETYDIKEVAIDRWNTTQLQTQLMGDGFEVIQFGQGFASMTAPTKELDKLVRGQQIAHGGNPVLRWMAGNAAVEVDAAGNMKLSKKKSTEKIDGMIATVMGIGRAMVAVKKKPSKYATGGLAKVTIDGAQAKQN